MYMLSGAPFKLDSRDNRYLRDCSGDRIELMGSSREILQELATEEKWRDTVVAYVSRTEYPRWAASCLKMFEIAPGITMHHLGTEQEIYPGSKKTHFRRIHERTGIEYEEMLFFDNESWNITEVATMGVCSVYCPNGMTDDVWNKGLEAYLLARKAREEGEKPKLAIKDSGRFW